MKSCQSPSITAAGTVRGLTQQGGGTNDIDVASGTPVDLNTPAGFTGTAGFTGS